MAKINDLPVEILLRIFQYYLLDKNQHCLLYILARVCKKWEAISECNELWRKLDGTINHNTIKRLHSEGRLNSAKELIISKNKYKSLHDTNAKNLFLAQISMKPKLFCEILCYEKTFVYTKLPRFIDYEIEFYFESIGRNLTTVIISHISIEPVNMFNCLSLNCPNLEHLNFTYNLCPFPGNPISISMFGYHFPKLRILQLDDNIQIDDSKSRHGFPCLEIFSYTYQYCDLFYDENAETVLFNSPNLRFLNLTRSGITAEKLCSLPAQSVEHLILSYSEVSNSSSFADIFKKWCYSLKQVDISYTDGVFVNDAMLVFTTLPIVPPLEFLDLSSTEVTSDTVRKIIEKCEKLETLCLTACKKIKRDLRKKYNGRPQLKELLVKLQPSHQCGFTDEKYLNKTF